MCIDSAVMGSMCRDRILNPAKVQGFINNRTFFRGL